MLPLVHDAHNHWLSEEALSLLHRLAFAQATAATPAAPQAWPNHVDQTAADAAASLMHPAVITAWTLHAACGRTK